jgi:hypothetical protein
MHCLVAFDGSPRYFRRPESEAGDDAFLDESVVLLDEDTPMFGSDSGVPVRRTPSVR